MAALDKIDAALLRALQCDGRATHTSLAKKVGLTPPAVLERVRKLEERGLIRGYHATVDPGLLGLQLRVFIAVTLARHQENAIGSFLGAISRFPQIIGHSHVTGRFDFILQGVFPDVGALEQFIAHKLTALPMIDRAETFLVLSGRNDGVLPISSDELQGNGQKRPLQKRTTRRTPAPRTHNVKPHRRRELK
jgi:Lrp/AsnC family leucine-responsive transcriptional regulator